MVLLDKLITPAIVCFCYGSTQKSHKVYQIMHGRFYKKPLRVRLMRRKAVNAKGLELFLVLTA